MGSRLPFGPRRPEGRRPLPARWSLVVALLTLLHVAAPAASTPRAQPAGDGAPAKSLTLRSIGTPLPEVVDAIATGAGMRLKVARELRACKATVVINQQPAGEVMARLAEVFGGEWRASAGDRPVYTLTRTKQVADWLREWRRARVAAEAAARRFQADNVRRLVDEALAALDRPQPLDEDGNPTHPDGVGSLPLARLVKSLSPEDREQSVQYIASISPVREGGEAAPTTPPILRPFSDFPATQQDLLRDYVRGGPAGSPLTEQAANRLEQLPNSMIEIGSQDGIQIGVYVHPPLPDTQYGQGAAGASYASVKLEEVLHEELFKRLGGLKTPEGALLGARITREGKPEPRVRLEDEPLGTRRVAGLPENGLAKELFPALAAGAALNLVADYHTRSARLALTGGAGEFRDLANRAAERMSSVVRQRGPYLLIRNGFWPDRDDEETPAPYPERWIDQKAAGVGLSVDDLIVMGCLTDPQLDGLGAYQDGGVHFAAALQPARKNRWVWALLATLKASERARAEGDRLAVQEMKPDQRALLARWVGPGLPWDRVALRIITWDTLNPERPHPAGGIYLLVPGNTNPLWSLDLQLPL